MQQTTLGLDAPLGVPGEARHPRGESRFLERGDGERIRSGASAARMLYVELLSPTPALRGQLGEAIEAAIEEVLRRRGAAPPGVLASSDWDASLSDQLFRARSVGARGIAVVLGDLRAITCRGCLDAEDSAALRFYVEACGERAVHVYLSPENLELSGYARALPLAEAVGLRSRGDAEVASPHEPARAPSVAVTARAVEPEVLAPVASPWATSAPTGTSATPSSAPRDPASPTRAGAPTPPAEAGAAPTARATTPSSAPRELRPTARATTPSSAPRELTPPARATTPSSAPRELTPPAEANAASAGGDAEPRARDGREAAPRDDGWRAWVAELEATQGPKPLAQIERIFATRYMPLLVREARGDLPDDAVRVREAWAEGFAKSYSEAFGTFRVTGKRPTMVLDAPQIATRLARLHGARQTELILVDALRYDLGQRIKSRLRAALGDSVTCAEEVLLWSALPTVTSTQLETLSQGADALGRRAEDDEDDTVLRGRNVGTLRRVRIGNREVKKLDVLEARLRDPNGPLAPRLVAAADEAAESLAAYFATLAPRTMVFVFGDHGFAIDGDGRTSGASRQGGALPEQVLVPGLAYLAGEVH